MVGNNEGSMVFGFKFFNFFGCVEKVIFQFFYGIKEIFYGLFFFKFWFGNFERNFFVNLYKVIGQFFWSLLWEIDRGMLVEYSFFIWKISYIVKWEGVW